MRKFSVLHNQQKEMQEFIRQFDRDFGAKKDRPGGEAQAVLL